MTARRKDPSPILREASLDMLLDAVEPEVASLVERLVLAADAKKLRLYVVGGPVRDLLLGRTIQDVDLIVEGHGKKAAEQLARAVRDTTTRIVVHERFGTVSVEREGATIDVATSRREVYAHPGALPDVEPGSLDEDLARRDFTVNALALPLIAGDPSRAHPVVDPSRGLADLERRVLRILHPRSFHDDPTRALRAARLAPRLGFSLSRRSRTALRSALRDGAFGALSGDRVRREIEKGFLDCRAGLDPSRMLKLLDEWHVLGMLEPGLVLPKEAVAPLRRLGKLLKDPPWRAQRLRPWLAGLFLWLAPLPPALRKQSLRRFSVRGEAARRAEAFGPKSRERLSALAGVRGRGAVDALLGDLGEEELLALQALADAAVRRRIHRWANEDRAARLPIGGDDLLAMGLAGPAIGEALGRIRAAYLDREVVNREEAIALAEELRRRPPTKARRKAAAKRTARRPAAARSKSAAAGAPKPEATGVDASSPEPPESP